MGTQAGASFTTIAIYFGVFLGAFYLLIVFPRKKQEKKHKQLLESLKKGDRVVSIGGIRAEVSRIKDEYVTLKVNENTEIELLKKAIAYRIEDE
ncbi:MAG: preprotein translocase subunit YajC [Syntrophomonas sp.]